MLLRLFDAVVQPMVVLCGCEAAFEVTGMTLFLEIIWSPVPGAGIIKTMAGILAAKTWQSLHWARATQLGNQQKLLKHSNTSKHHAFSMGQTALRHAVLKLHGSSSDILQLLHLSFVHRLSKTVVNEMCIKMSRQLQLPCKAC